MDQDSRHRLPRINSSKSKDGLSEIIHSPTRIQHDVDTDIGEESTKQKHFLTLESLQEEGKRYLQEKMGLPPIDLSSAMRYVNIHPTDSIMSTEEWEIWWDLQDYEDPEDCCVYREDGGKLMKEEGEKDFPLKVLLGRRSYPLTKADRRERRLKEKIIQESRKAQIVSDLEKRMVSLYRLKKRYRRNFTTGQSCQPHLTLPLVENHSLARQKENLLNKIKRKKIEEELKRRQQLDRQLHIINKLVQEHRAKTKMLEVVVKKNQQEQEGESKLYIKHTTDHEDEGFRASGKVFKEKTSSKRTTKVPGMHYNDSERIYHDEVEAKNTSTDVDENFVSHENEILKDSNAIDFKDEKLNGNKIGSKIVEQENEENMESNAEVDEPKKIVSEKKGKKTTKGPGIAKEKVVKKKPDKKILGEEEPSAAILQEPLELQSEIPDLLLWFENWRQTHEAEQQNLRDFEAQKIPLEKELVVTPNRVVFKDVLEGHKARQTVSLLNSGLTPVKIRVQGVYSEEREEMAAYLQVALEGPSKIPTGGVMTMILTLHITCHVEDCSLEVKLMFARADESKSVLSVWVDVLTPCAQPVLSTGCIRFDPQVFWSSSQFTKQLHIKNLGSVDCNVHWTRQTDLLDTLGVYEEASRDGPGEQKAEDLQGIEPNFDEPEPVESVIEFLETVIRNVFSTFRVDAQQNFLLTAGSDVTVPVRFRPSMSKEKGDAFCKYTFSFEGDSVKNSEQELLVCGHIVDSAFKVSPEVLDMTVCYTGGSVQQEVFQVLSTARHACTVLARVPKLLTDLVCVLPKEAVVQACSSLSLTVRVILSWDFITSDSAYFDKDTNILSFPVHVSVLDTGVSASPPLLVTVMALVAPPCPLTVSPSCIPLGQVSTQETVCADVVLSNHDLNCTYTYCFYNLPESVLVEPGGGCGRILPGENLSLQVLYSPTAKDLGVKCGSPGRAGDLLIHLQCYTTVSLASAVHVQDASTNRASHARYNSLASSPTTIDQKSLASDDVTSREESLTVRTSSSLKEQTSTSGLQVDTEVKDSLVSEDVKENVSFQHEDTLTHDTMDTNMITVNNDSESATFESLKSEFVWETWAAFQVEQWDQLNLTKQSLVSHRLSDDRTFKDVHSDTNKEKDSYQIAGTANEEINQSQFDDNYFGVNKKRSMTSGMDTNLTSFSTGKLSEKSAESLEMHEVEGRFEYEALPKPDQRCTSLSLQAHVVDPLVELSAQTVVMPTTPCMSHSVANIYLRSRVQPNCRTHKKNQLFKTNFEFRCLDEEIVIEPRKGHTQYKQNVKISICFKPLIKTEEIYSKAFEIKLDKMRTKIMEDMLDQYYQLKAKKEAKKSPKEKSTNKKASTESDVKSKRASKSEGSKKGKKLSKASVVSTKTKKSAKPVRKKESAALPDVVVDPSQVEVTEEDLRAGRMWLLKYWETQTKRVLVQCLLETELEPGVRRSEMLTCQVVCTTVAPTLFLNSSNLDFDPTAVGCTSNLEAEIVNLSFLDAQVHLATLSPTGPFMCPMKLEAPFKINSDGLELPPEHSLRLPIHFEPISRGKFQEVFEVASGNTVLYLKARGEAVYPNFVFSPDQQVFTVTCVPGKKSDVVVKITNTCRATLPFILKQTFVKEGFSLPPVETSPSVSPNSSKSPKKEKKSKMKTEFTSLTPELEAFIKTEFIDVPLEGAREPLFKLFNTTNNFELLADESKDVIIRFTNEDEMKYLPTLEKEKKSKSPSSKRAPEKDTETIAKKGKVKGEKSLLEKNKKIQSDKNVKREQNEDKSLNSRKIFATQFQLLLANKILLKEFVILAVPKK